MIVQGPRQILLNQGSFPGQIGNPVGFSATPASPPLSWTGGATWPGAYPGSLTLYGGGDINTGGTDASNYRVISFTDFNSGTAGQVIGSSGTPSFIKFIGCRFQSADIPAGGTPNVQISAGTHHEFYYCTFGPIVSAHPQPPSGGGYSLWPTGGTGQQQVPDKEDGSGLPNLGWKTFAIPYQSCAQYSVRFYGGGNGLMDHCDIWGFGNSVVMATGTSNYTFQDCWVHDCQWCGDTGQIHCDGIGFIDPGTPPSNVIVNHCTIAAEGVEQGFAGQFNSDGAANNWQLTNSYITGWDNAVYWGNRPANSVCKNNIFGTEVPWTFLPVSVGPGGSTANSWFTSGNAFGNSWANNKLKVYPGTSCISTQSPWTSTDNGKFIYPDCTYNTVDFT